MKKILINQKDLESKTLEKYLSEQYPTRAKRAKADERFNRLALGYKIYLARKKQKLTQKSLAQKLNTTQSEIARIEAGEQNVTTDKLDKIAHALERKLEISLV